MIPAPRPDWSLADLTTPLCSEAEPPASLETLAAAEWWTRALCCSPYAGTLRIFDGVTLPATVRRLTISINPGTRYARIYGSRYAYGTPAAIATSKASSSDTGLATYSIVSCAASGSEAFAPLVQQGGEVVEVIGGDDTNLADGVQSLLGLPESLSVDTETIEARSFCAFSLLVPPNGQSADLETL